MPDQLIEPEHTRAAGIMRDQHDLLHPPRSPSPHVSPLQSSVRRPASPDVIAAQDRRMFNPGMRGNFP